METIKFSGLRELDRALGQADKDLRAILRRDLKEIAAVAATRAQEIAQEKGEVRSGDMVRRIAPFALLRGTGVRSSSVHRGYRYVRRLEFEGRAGSGYGPHAVINPAVDEVEPELYARAGVLLDRLAIDLAK